MLQMLSIPTWFLTLSAADLYWAEIIQAEAVQFGKKLTQKDVLKLSIADRSKYLCQTPSLVYGCSNIDLRHSSLNTF